MDVPFLFLIKPDGMIRFRRLLLPFSWLYGAIMALRNKLFDFGILSSVQYSLPVISVGNLTVGGTGKTPVTEHLLHLLLPNYRCATLSRGYGRKTKGVIISGSTDNYTSIGDEPMQMKLKFPQATIAVAEKRVDGLSTLLNWPSPPEVVLLDDAFQHRYVKPGLSIMVMDYHRPLWKDSCLPAGNLREKASGINRAHVIIINKCPAGLESQEALKLSQQLKLKNQQPVFFTAIDYMDPVPIANSPSEGPLTQVLSRENASFLAVTGIGNPGPFYESLKRYYIPFETLTFKDHHAFTADDLRQMAGKEATHPRLQMPIITTEKDAIRLYDTPGMTPELLSRLWYVPIRLKFLFNEQATFDKIITDYAKENK
jgi:tetraacyldisaccharide 4'-kinase